MQPTVVSAYYPIKSKFSPEKYVEWMMSFWPKTQHPLVFFTDPEIVPLIEEMFKDRAGPTRIVGLPFKELAAFQKMSTSVWLTTHGKDPEAATHTPQLYALWYEKKEFVLRAIQLNPFGSEHFVWCDAGICRYPEWLPHLRAFPQAHMIPPGDRMLVLRINPFTATEAEKDGILGKFESVNTVGGGILAASAVGWNRWNDAYDKMFMRYTFADRFVGKDQNIMASICLEQPDLVHLIDPPATMNSMQRWFYLLFFLAGVRVV